MVWVKTLMKPKCFVSNKYLAQKLGCSERQVSRYLKALEEEGKIVRTQYRYSKKGALKTKRYVSLKTKWLPALVVPPKRFENYERKDTKAAEVKDISAPKLLSQEELVAMARSRGWVIPDKDPTPTLEERRKAETRYLNRPKLAGVVYSAGLQAIIDRLPNKG